MYFSWICLGPWKGHSQCNKYTATDDSKKTASRAALDRYLHYFHRYTVHEESKKFEGKLWESVNAKMRAIQDTDPSRLVDVQYVFDATEQLIECRRTLKYTYVFGFYLEDGPEKQLFSFLQSDLETTTENLSHLLENLIGKDPRQLKDLTHLANRKLRNLLEGIEEGLTSGVGGGRQPEPAPVVVTTNDDLNTRFFL